MRKRLLDKKTNDPNRWLVSYADFITLLFAFFVVMYAVSSINLGKYKQFSDATKAAFEPVDSTVIRPLVAAEQISTAPFLKAEVLPIFLKDQAVTVRQEQDWVELVIDSHALFASGGATPSQQARTLLKQLASKLKDQPYHVVVEGHTDNIPIQNKQFASNWELSAARAASVVRVLSSMGVDAHRLTALGYADNYPTATNQTKSGRTKNRRVVIIIAKNKAAQRLLNPPKNKFSVQRKIKDKKISVNKRPIKAVEILAPDSKKVTVIKEIRLKNGGIKITKGSTVIKKGAKVPAIIQKNE